MIIFHSLWDSRLKGAEEDENAAALKIRQSIGSMMLKNWV